MSVTAITISMMSVTVNRYHGVVSRWEPNARGRLEKAALELYLVHGFEQTTVAEIAAKAELTERTFFRYFSDKREVLFSGARQLQDALVTAVSDSPASFSALDAVAAALNVASDLFQERGEHARQRQIIIEATAELKERELIKMATLAGAIANALRGRGVREPAASLTAEAGIAVFRVAFERWVTHDGQHELRAFMNESLAELRKLSAP